MATKVGTGTLDPVAIPVKSRSVPYMMSAAVLTYSVSPDGTFGGAISVVVTDMTGAPVDKLAAEHFRLFDVHYGINELRPVQLTGAVNNTPILGAPAARNMNMRGTYQLGFQNPSIVFDGLRNTQQIGFLHFANAAGFPDSKEVEQLTSTPTFSALFVGT
ncbi:hypothetical protein [Paraburkholderia sp. GAS42]|jgi:hypothetical protein|uniref:hypothetical protein n=1 Tax=Paraburkholderia sp. GAS42 TaxID=3035135 RepID=UPI003D1DFE31